MKLPRHKMQVMVCASEAQAREERERYLDQREAVRLHGLTGGLVLFEEIGRIKESVGSIPLVRNWIFPKSSQFI